MFGALESISLLTGLPGIIFFKTDKRSSRVLVPVPKKDISTISYNKDVDQSIKSPNWSDTQIFLIAQGVI